MSPPILVFGGVSSFLAINPVLILGPEIATSLQDSGPQAAIRQRGGVGGAWVQHVRGVRECFEGHAHCHIGTPHPHISDFSRGV